MTIDLQYHHGALPPSCHSIISKHLLSSRNWLYITGLSLLPSSRSVDPGYPLYGTEYFPRIICIANLMMIPASFTATTGGAPLLYGFIFLRRSTAASFRDILLD